MMLECDVMQKSSPGSLEFGKIDDNDMEEAACIVVSQKTLLRVLTYR